MKKAKDDMRREYKRSDFKKLERGKLYAEEAKGTAVALRALNRQGLPDLAGRQRSLVRAPGAD
ncbi:MAG: hypothetical protein KGJ40_02730 [candidate division NC10 bacterium]|nr:hypothetical protein [candidate division NC10 bacterium]